MSRKAKPPKKKKRLLELALAPGAAHRCVGCGSSCMHAGIGPLMRSEIDKLVPQVPLLREKLPELPETLWYRDPESPVERYFLEGYNERCVFLQPDQRCGIHIHLGAEFKPTICRRFPLQISQTPDGITISRTLECRRALESTLEGDLSAEERQWLEQHMADYEPDYVFGWQVMLRPGCEIGYRSWTRLEQELLPLATNRQTSILQRIPQVNRGILEFESGQTPTPDRQLFRQSMNTLLHALSGEFEALVPDAGTPMDRLMWRQLADLGQAMAGWIDPGQHPLDSEAERLLELFVVQQIAGKHWLREPTVLDGLALSNFKIMLTLGLAGLRASLACRLGLVGRDINDALVMIQLVIRHPALRRFISEQRRELRFLFVDCWLA